MRNETGKRRVIGRSRSESARVWPQLSKECPRPIGNGWTATESGPSISFGSVPEGDVLGYQAEFPIRPFMELPSRLVPSGKVLGDPFLGCIQIGVGGAI